MLSLKNRIAVVGVGHTTYGNFPERSDYSLAAEAFSNALEDSGLQKHQIDGLGCCRIPYYVRMGEVLGIDPIVAAREKIVKNAAKYPPPL